MSTIHRRRLRIRKLLLHLTLAANLLNAVGGTPNLTNPGFLPEDYPVLPARWRA